MVINLWSYPHDFHGVAQVDERNVHICNFLYLQFRLGRHLKGQGGLYTESNGLMGSEDELEMVVCGSQTLPSGRNDWPESSSNKAYSTHPSFRSSVGEHGSRVSVNMCPRIVKSVPA